jgi:GT2 family glycosyltransferase
MSQKAARREIGMLSVIIVAFNTCELLRDCLTSINAHEDNPPEIIVVDNMSTDGSAQMVGADFPGVRLIENSENLGFSKATNQGFREAKGEYLLLLNSDTVVRPCALRAMKDFLEGHPDVGGVTCRLLNADGSIQACVSRRPGPMLLLFRFSRLSRLIKSDKARRFLRKYLGFLMGSTARSYLDPYTAASSPIEVENVSAACLMMRRQAVQEVGPFDEKFFMYLEDTDYCVRLRDAGWKLYYVPTGEIVHLVGRSSGGQMRDHSVHSYRSLFYFYRKHYSFMTLVVVRLLVLCTIVSRWLWSLICGRFSNPLHYRQNRLDLEQVMRLYFE